MGEKVFTVLGPVEVRGDDGPVALGGPRGQAILAALLLNANRVVGVDQLVDAVWGEEPPRSARTQVRNRVGALRKLLGDELIATTGSGYAIRVDDGWLDVARFDNAVAEALATEEPEQSAAQLAAALALWRGPALDGLNTPYLRSAAHHLEERRMAALSRRLRLDLDLGRHAELVPELTALTALHPYREDLFEMLMLALYRTSGQAAALERFNALRTMLADQLGVAPGSALRRLHESILRADDALRSPTPPPRSVPRTLPPDLADFTGRATELTELDDLVSGTSATVVISAIAGTAGVGKTALAVRFAHRVADRFPDGQLYVDLCGYAARSPLRPIDVVGVLLRTLGARPDQVPVDLAEAVALYRSMLSGRRVLVLLDNACSVEQVRPLLPGSPGCLVVVTSRERLGGLVARDGARRITLDVLTPDEAAALLTHLVGEDRTRAEPDAAAELTRVCAYLPLALRIAAAHLVDRPHRRIAEYVAGLRHGDRLTTLAVDGDEDAAVRATLDLSYRTIPQAAQRMFRLLGLLPGADLTTDAAAALADLTTAETSVLLNRLAGAHLIREHAPDRYGFHDLLRQYARERAETEDSATERDTALRRLLDWYLRTIAAARQLLHRHLFGLPLPDPAADVFADRAAALAWLDEERPNLLAAIERAGTHGPRDMAWRLADAVRGYFAQRSHLTDWLTACRTALDAAHAEGHLGGQVTMHHSIAHAHYWLGHNPESIEHLTTARSLAHETGWTEAEAAIGTNLGIVQSEIGMPREAARQFGAALVLRRRLGDAIGEASTLQNLANYCRWVGRPYESARYVRRTFEACRRAGGLPTFEASAVSTLATVHHDLGHLGVALDLINEVVARNRTLGNSHNEALNLLNLAAVHADLGDHDVALHHAEICLRLSRKSQNRLVRGRALTAVGNVYERLGRPAEAAVLYEQAYIEATHSRYTQIVALIGLAATGSGVERAHHALALADHSDYRVLAVHALTTLAVLHRRTAPAKATAYARWALTRAHHTHNRLGQARAHIALNACLTGPAAQTHRQAALRIHTAAGVPHAEHERALQVARS